MCWCARADLHFSECIAKLVDTIRSTAMVLYFTPYSVVDLNRMAAAFNTRYGGAADLYLASPLTVAVLTSWRASAAWVR